MDRLDLQHFITTFLFIKFLAHWHSQWFSFESKGSRSGRPGSLIFLPLGNDLAVHELPTIIVLRNNDDHLVADTEIGVVLIL